MSELIATKIQNPQNLLTVSKSSLPATDMKSNTHLLMSTNKQIKFHLY